MMIRGLALALLACALARANAAMEEASRLYAAKDYTGAEAAFRKIVSAEPDNAEANHFLGMAIVRSAGADALDEAPPWLEHAATLAANNATFYQDYGETCFFAAKEKRSVIYAVRGRNALKRAVEIDGNALSSREMLMEFYARAPWPLGNHKEALEQAAEIASRDKIRGISGYLLLAQIFEQKKNPKAGIQACREVLKLDPSNPTASSLEVHLETL